ncbi:MAG TPA: SDR family NAD(P)-dependent oxidoreductase, partial [Thermoleophilaceae bacterium]
LEALGLDRKVFDDEELLQQTQYTQTSLFAVEVALFRLAEWHGLKADHLIGHSIGDLAAAHCAGVLSLEDAAKLVSARGRLMGELPQGGVMIAVQATEEEVLEVLPEGLEIAAVNAERSVVVAGDDVPFEVPWKTTRLRVSHAFHSHHMDPMLDAFREVAESLTYSEPQIDLVGGWDADHWVRHVREPVRFADRVKEVEGARLLELGPDGVLSALAGGVPSMRKGRSRFPQMLASAWTTGAEVDWRLSGAIVDLPTYPFERRRYWVEPSHESGSGHPLLDAAIPLAGEDEWLFTARLSLQAQPWIGDHVAFGRVVLPSTTLVELLLRAGAEIGCGTVDELTLEAPLLLPERGTVEVQVAVEDCDDAGRHAFTIHSRLAGTTAMPEDDDWTRNASGVLAPAGAPPEEAEQLAAEAWPPEGAEPIEHDAIYGPLTHVGFDYGPAFHGLRGAWRRGDEIFAEVAFDEERSPEAARYGLHPALLDTALHAGLATIGMGDPVGPGQGKLMFRWSGVRRHANGASSLRVRAVAAGGDALHLTAIDESGAPVVSVESLLARTVDTKQIEDALTAGERSLYRIEWVDAKPGEHAPSGVVLIDPPAELDLDGERHPDLASLARAIDDGGDAPGAVVIAAPSGSGDTAAAQARDAVRRTLDLLQLWLGDERWNESRLVLLTRDAAGDPPELAAASVWGLLRSAESEDPGRFQAIDLDGSAASWAAVGTALAAGEAQVALRDGTARVPRLTRARLRAGGAPPRLDGTVLVTGGTAGIGATVARHLASERGARHLLLVSRRGPDADGAAELEAGLRELGAEPVLAACDVADREALQELLGAIPADRPLRAIIHAAGVLDDGVIESLDARHVETVMRPKADAALLLHELTRDSDLRAFVMFSSAASTLGNAGQGNYAAANAFLDALALRRAADGLPATSLAWGAWAQRSGMTARLGEQGAERIARLGIAPLPAEEALALLDRALGAGEPLLVPARLDMHALRARARTAAVPPILREIVPVTARPQERGGGGGSLARRLGEAPEVERDGVALELVRGQVASVLGHASADAVAPEQAFKEMGFDSLSAVELRNRLDQATGLRLPSTLVFDHPTPAAVARFLRAQVEPDRRASARRTRARKRTDEPLAIVGMACRYPGGVHSPDDLWELVANGTDAITGFPTDRGWELDGFFHPDPDHPSTSYVDQGGFVHDAPDFDAEFFGIAPREATAMDPQQRLLLEATWEAFEDAGIDPATVRGTATGVFAGGSASDYARTVPGELEGFRLTGSTTSVVSGRVAYAFGLEGPAVTVDTACSSSLVAIHMASQSLRQGECSMAVACGVTVMDTPALFVDFSRQRGLARDGRCKSFSAAADGTIWSEGAGVLVMERLSDARRLGHRVLGVVRGSAVNQDGASNGLTAPNGPSQERVIREALAAAGLEPGDVSAVEAHGTGTTLGDPIEAQALIATYGEERTGDPLWLGTIKSNIGHSVAAAGVAGVIKMVMAMRHGVLPKTLHVDEPSPHVQWRNVELLTEPREWSGPRRAGVSSFGVSGTNAHVILEEGLEEPAVETPAEAPLVFSAKTEAALDAQLEWDLGPEAAYTLAQRAQLEHRAVRIGSDVIRGRAEDRKTVFLFTGQGAQRAGMGSDLYETSPVFAEAFDEALEALQLDRSVFDDEELLQRTQYTQTSLFALEVALFRLAEWHGLKPDHLIGHSIGDLAAAHCAGVLSLEDAAKLVSARGRLMGELPEGGVMIAVQASEEEVLEVLPEGLEIAAVNAERSVVVAGDDVPFEVPWRTTRLRVSHAFHSHRMDPMLDEFRSVAESLTYSEPQIDLVGGWDAEHWVRHVREPVRFAERVAKVEGARLLELGPDGVLSALAGGVPSMRKGRSRFPQMLASAWTSGAEVDWRLEGRIVDLPKYPFQRRRFWLEPGNRRDLVRLANGGAVLTTDLSLGTDQWLRDHAVLDTVLLPGTAFVELALAAGGDAIEELTIEAPLVLPEDGSAHVQVTVGAADDDDRRPVEIHSRTGEEWVRHAAGVVAGEPEPAAALGAWPPEGAEPVDADTLYDRLAEAGMGYGPAFQGLQAAWRRGDELFAEVALAEEQAGDAERFAIHPALFDAALHTLFLDGPDEVRLPFAWTGVALHARGAAALRVSVAPAEGGVSVTMHDPSGAPVATVDALAGRAVDAGQLAASRGAGNDSLFTVEWTEVQPASTNGTPRQVELVELSTLHEALSVVQERLAGEAPPDARLVFVTRGAVAVGDGEVPDLEAAPIWGLLRSAQSENPGRFAIADVRGDSLDPLLAAPIDEEPQLALRDGELHAPRLVRAPAPADEAPPLDPGGTVLITGGTGGLGALFARHLVEEHGVRRLVLVSRRGPGADGADELEALDADVTIAACDVSDRDALAALIAEHEPAAIVHAAGVLDDGVIESLDAERLDRVMGPKAVAARHLHELAPDAELILFSSVAATVGAPGQGNYAAANATLDALAQVRRAAGGRAVSLAWGPWAAGMAGALGEADQARVRRLGLVPLEAAEGLALFDAARAVAAAQVAPVHLDMGALRAQAGSGLVPALLRKLVRVPAKRAPAAGDSLARRLANVPEEEWDAAVLDLVRGEVAAVLGHPSGDAIDPVRAFKELGFDSLGAVELRNRLINVTGMRLPATLVFDHPSPAAVAELMRARLASEGGPRSELDEEIAKVESLLTQVGDGERERVEGRLRALASRINSVLAGDGNGAGEEEGDDEEDLESASDEDIFELIDKEFGS